jgi:hypothetical protein
MGGTPYARDYLPTPAMRAESVQNLNSLAKSPRAKRHVLQHADQIVIGEHVLTYVVT